MIQRGEFLTSYTPYQPEITQGTLQYLFEFQTQVSLLTGMEVANASMYDGSTGASEAVLMANRITRRHKALISGGLHPQYRRIIETAARWEGFSAVAGKADPRRAGRPDRPGRQGDVLRRRAESELLRPCARLRQARRSLPCRRRAADRGGDRGRLARPDKAAGRDGRRHRGLRGPVDRQRAGLRRPLCRPVRHPRQVRAPDAGPAVSARPSMPTASAASC